MDRGIYILEYLEGIREAFVFHYRQEPITSEKLGYSLLGEDIFTSWTTGNTLGRRTIEKLLKEDGIKHDKRI